MGIIYNLYEVNKIKVDNDIFISTLFYQLNQVEDFSFFDSLFKNGLIPLNHKLGLYLVDRATHSEKDKNQKEDKKEKDKHEISDNDIMFYFGLENKMEKEDGTNEAIEDLMDEKKYSDCFDLASYYLCETKMNSQGNLGYFRNFVNEQLYQFNKKGNSEEENNINNMDDELNKENDEKTI